MQWVATAAFCSTAIGRLTPFLVALEQYNCCGQRAASNRLRRLCDCLFAPNPNLAFIDKLSSSGIFGHDEKSKDSPTSERATGADYTGEAGNGIR